MSIELSDIEHSLESDTHAPGHRISTALDIIGKAKRQGGQILYLTPSEVRFLSVAREALKAIHGWQMWRCPKCDAIETVSSCYHGKYCMKCHGPMEVWGNELAASSTPEASSSPAPQVDTAPPPAPPPALNLEYVLRQFRYLSQAMLGMYDCEKPDKEARGKALAEWICMRDQLDIVLQP